MLCPLQAQDRRLPVEDVLRRQASQFRLGGAWIGGGLYDLGGSVAPDGNSRPGRLYRSGSAGLSLGWNFIGGRTTGWANYSGDYSLASVEALSSFNQFGEFGVMRRISPRASIGVSTTAQNLNIGARLFQTPNSARQLQSQGFGGGSPTVGLGNSTNPIGEAGALSTAGGVYGVTLGSNQRSYAVSVFSGFTFSQRSDFRIGVSASRSDFPRTPGVEVQLPFTRAYGGYLQGGWRYLLSPSTSITWSFDGGQNQAAGQKLNFFSQSFGFSKSFSMAWSAYASGGAGASSTFSGQQRIPWTVQYTGQAGLSYAGRRHGMMIIGQHTAGDRLALGFESTSIVNVFWNLRPPASGWAFSVNAGGVLLRSRQLSQLGNHAATLQLGLSRRLFGDVYVLGEGSYATSVLSVPQRLFAAGTGTSGFDGIAQRAVRLSVVYRPAPDRK